MACHPLQGKRTPTVCKFDHCLDPQLEFKGGAWSGAGGAHGRLLGPGPPKLIHTTTYNAKGSYLMRGKKNWHNT